MGLALITDPQSFTPAYFKPSLGWKGGCLLIFRGKHCSLSNAAKLYEELLIKWIHPAAEARGSAESGWEEAEGAFPGNRGLLPHLPPRSWLRIVQQQKARLLGFLYRSKGIMLQMCTEY